MEQEERDALGRGELPTPKRLKTTDPYKKNVVVLLESDVRCVNDQVLMPNTIEMARIHKHDKGQYKSNIEFTTEMTEMQVKERLLHHFPILRPCARLSCASAKDNRTMLDFHEESQHRGLWNGAMIKKHLKGNSALYVFGETSESGRIPTRLGDPTVAYLGPTSSGSVLPASERLKLISRKSYPSGSPVSLRSSPNQIEQGYGILQVDSSQQRTDQQPISLEAPVIWSRVPETTPPLGYVGQATKEQQRTREDQSNRPKVVSEISVHADLLPGSQCGLHSSVLVSSQSQIGQGQITSTCLGNNTVGDQISQNAQTSGASLTEPGILQNDPLQQIALTADQQPTSHMSDSGRDSIRSNALGLAVASDPAEQSGDISAPSEIFDLSEDIDSILEEGSEVMFECLTQSSGVVKEIIPSQGCTETDIRFCILLGQKLPRNYKGLSFQANFANIATVPLKRDGPALTGNIISSLAGKVKVTLEYKGSNGKSIGFTYFEFTKNSERVILEEISKVRMSQDAMYKTVNSLAVSRSSGVQQETPPGARGTGVGSSNMNKRNDALPEEILTLLVYKAAEIEGREFLEMVFSTSVGRVLFNHYRNNLTLPEDVARANGHTILGDFLEDVNERLSKEVCRGDNYETIDWLELKYAVDKKICLPSANDAQAVSSPVDDVNQSGYEADDEASSLPSPADTNANGSEMHDSEHGDIEQITSDVTKSRSSLPQPMQPIPEEQPEEVFSVKYGSASDMHWQLDDTKSAIYKYLLEYGRKEFPSHKKTLKQLKNNLARLKDEDQLRETLTGVTEERSSPFHALIAEVASHVIVANVRLKLPGLRKFFTDGIGKHVLNSVERKHSCLIEILDDKTRADLSDEIQTCFDSALAEFERISDVFKTHMGSPEVVDENVWRERSWKRTPHELSEDSSRSTWIKNTQICVCMGDVTKEMTDSLLIMNTNTLELKKGGQLNKDIDRTAGPSVRKECKRIISRDGAQFPGNIVMTGAGDLPCKNLIHVIAYPGSPQILDLQMGVKMGLKFADERGMGSIVLPAIGAGAMGLSPTNSARVLTRAILSFLESPPRTIREIRIVLFDESLLSTFHDEMKNEFAPIQALEGFFPLSMPPKEEDCITAMTPLDVAFHEGYGNTPPIATAEFRVYGKDKKCVTTVINSLRGKFVKYCTVQKVTHQEVPRLIQSCWAWLRHLGSKHDTDLKKDEHNSTIVVSGNWDDVCLVVSCIRQKIDRLIENQQALEKRKLMTQYVQWHYVILDQEIAVNEKVSSTIEEAWTKKQDGVAFCMSNNTYKVDFKSMTVVSSDMKYPPLRLSRKLHTETGVVTPDSWSTQPYFADGKPVPVTMFPLPEMEYQSVANMFYSTGGAGTIVRIDRVQNPCLYTQYITYKQDVEQKNSRSGRIVRNELQLFHGTKGSNVSAINRHGFNRTFAGTTHGAAFGNGVYFASRASYSKGYTAPDSNGLRHMYLARVVVGFYTLGQRGLLVPPAIPCHEPEVLFDSVVDNTENPAVFVVFRDAQCYPEYLITFKT